MLFPEEKEAHDRWAIPEHPVCTGCIYLGTLQDEPRFCIMRQKPDTCSIAVIAGRNGEES